MKGASNGRSRWSKLLVQKRWNRTGVKMSIETDQLHKKSLCIGSANQRSFLVLNSLG